MRGGIDLGGTKIQAVVLDARNGVRGEARLPTPSEGGPPDVVASMAEALGQAVGAAGVTMADLSGVGVGSPGAVDADAGTVAEARNLPNWGDEPYAMAATLEERTGSPVKLGNDVQVGVDAEFALGAGKDSDSLLGVFWGTGVGAVCPCGRRGCLEAYAGRGAMEARARKLVKEGHHTDLFKIMEKRGRTRLQSGIWARALDRGDPMAVKLVDRAVEALGAGIASAINLLDVETVVIGGGLGTRLGEPYVRRIREEMGHHLFVPERPPAVRLAALGDLGGAIGAALLVPARRRPVRRRAKVS